MNSKISSTIPDEIIVIVSLKIAEIQSLLDPYLIELSPEEYLNAQVLKNKFSNSGNIPKAENDHTDKELLARTIKVYNQLLPLSDDFSRLSKKLDDTIMEAGTKSFVNSVNYFNMDDFTNHLDLPANDFENKVFTVPVENNGNTGSE